MVRGVPEETEERLYGSFRGQGRCRAALLSLGRLSWGAGVAEPVGLWDLPLPISVASRAVSIELAGGELWVEKLAEFFSGETSALVDELAAVPMRIGNGPLRALLEQDLLELQEFYEAGPAFNRRVAAEAGLVHPDLAARVKLEQGLARGTS